MANTKIDELCNYLNANKAKLYPIENDMLKSATDFIVNGYLKMLGVVLQQPSEITEAQLAIYKRIIAGSGSEKSAEEYLRMALEIEIEDYINFTSEIKELSLKYRFLLDAIILTCISDKNQKQIKLVADFTETLSIDRKELEYITLMAKAILCLDTSMYVDACEIENVGIPEDIFYGYIRLLAKGCVIHNDNMTIFQPSCEEDVTVEMLSLVCEIDTPIIKLYNVKVNLEECPLKFLNYKKVIVDSCEFVGGNKYSISFDNCEEVIISKSIFKDFKVRTICTENVKRMRINQSTYSNCYMIYSECCDNWKPLGGVIYVQSGMESMLIDNCLFDSCGGKNQDCYVNRSAIIANYNCEVSNTKFINCWHYSCKEEFEDSKDERRTMFLSGSKAIRCTLENSAAFCL